jgi:hypothetical protein
MLNIKLELHENRPSNGHILLITVNEFLSAFPTIRERVLLKFGIDYFHVLAPSDYELHAIGQSESYILLRCQNEIFSLLPYL